MDVDKRINAKLRDVNVTPKDVFTSSTFVSYLRTLLSYPCRSIRRKLPSIRIGWAEKGPVAYTDNREIFINAGSEVVEWAGSKLRKTRIIIGLLVHEYGHIRFTDFTSIGQSCQAILAASLYPALPSNVPKEISDNYIDYVKYAKANPKKLSLLVSSWKSLENICEDGFIEECLYYAMNGILLDSLNYLRKLQRKDAVDLHTMLDQDGYDETSSATVFSVYSNLLLTFMKYGIIKCDRNNQDEMDSLPMQYMVKSIPLAQKLFTEPRGVERSSLTNQLFLTVWPLIKGTAEENLSPEELQDILQEILKSMASQMPSMSGSGGGIPVPLSDKEKGTSHSPASKKQKQTARKMAPKSPDDEDDGKEDSGSDAKAAKPSKSSNTEAGKDDGASSAASGSDSDDADDTEDSDGTGGNDSDGDSEDEKPSDGDNESSSADDSSSEEDGSDAGEDDGDGDSSDGGDNSEVEKKDEDDAEREKSGPGSDDSDGTVDKNGVVAPVMGNNQGKGDDPAVEDPIHPDMLPDSELAPGEEGDLEEEEIDEEYDDKALMDALSVIEKQVATDKAVELVNEELNASLQDEVNNTDFGAIHKNMKALVRRVGRVSPELIELYERETKDIQTLAKTMARKVAPYLKKKDDMANMPLTGFFSGPRFDATRLALNDLRNFRLNNSPMPDTRVAASILVDESGSMSGTRIRMALNASLALYLFCEECKIRCAVTGHTAENRGQGSMDLNVYADFDTPDRNDKYRLMNIQARSCNRDGAALMFAGNHLLKAEEPTKILFVISDGTPNATGYSGRPAEMDLAEIAAGLRRKGVILFALAIGEDKDSIHRIYGDGFIDITDINTMPDQLVQLVKRYIR